MFTDSHPLYPERLAASTQRLNALLSRVQERINPESMRGAINKTFHHAVVLPRRAGLLSPDCRTFLLSGRNRGRLPVGTLVNAKIPKNRDYNRNYRPAIITGYADGVYHVQPFGHAGPWHVSPQYLRPYDGSFNVRISAGQASTSDPQVIQSRLETFYPYRAYTAVTDHAISGVERVVNARLQWAHILQIVGDADQLPEQWTPLLFERAIKQAFNKTPDQLGLFYNRTMQLRQHFADINVQIDAVIPQRVIATRMKHIAQLLPPAPATPPRMETFKLRQYRKHMGTTIAYMLTAHRHGVTQKQHVAIGVMLRALRSMGDYATAHVAPSLFRTINKNSEATTAFIDSLVTMRASSQCTITVPTPHAPTTRDIYVMARVWRGNRHHYTHNTANDTVLFTDQPWAHWLSRDPGRNNDTFVVLSPVCYTMPVFHTTGRDRDCVVVNQFIVGRDPHIPRYDPSEYSFDSDSTEPFAHAYTEALCPINRSMPMSWYARAVHRRLNIDYADSATRLGEFIDFTVLLTPSSTFVDDNDDSTDVFQNVDLIGGYHSCKRFLTCTAPDPKPNGVYIGYELELEVASNAYPNNEAKRLDKLLNEQGKEKYCGFERDGSISRGFELVSSWTTLEMHREKVMSAFARPAPNLRSHNTTTCGLHVHISKGDMSLMHAARLQAFMHNRANESLITAVARRYSSGSGYAKQANKSIKEVTRNALVYAGAQRHLSRKARAKSRTMDALCQLNPDRYELVNFQNRATVEFRAFRGTTVGTTIMACIEFAWAVYWFSRDHGAHELTTPAFLQYINHPSRRKETAQLRARLHRKGFAVYMPRKNRMPTAA